MEQIPTASEWTTARGERWCAQLSGMEGMLLPIEAPLLQALQLDAPSRIAEVGCGGGGTALEILRRAPAGSIVHGFDIAPVLVARARDRARSEGLGVTFEVANMATAKPDKPYDRLVSRFGVMFFDDPEAAFANLARWLAPGGRFAFAVWGRISENPWMSTVRDVVANIVEIPQSPPDAPGAFRYGDSELFLALLARAGFAKLEVRDWRGPVAIGGGLPPAEAAHFAIAAFSSFGELLARAGDEALREGQRALTAAFANHVHEGVVRMDASVHLVTGTRA